MNDDVTVSIRQIDGAWRLMCAGGPEPAVAAREGIQYIFSGVPIGFFNLAVLTDSDLSAEALGTRGCEACASPLSGRTRPVLLQRRRRARAARG
jgi:hypothetical protein